MPHINIEYTANLEAVCDIAAAMQAVNSAIIETALFEGPDNVKSRGVMLPHFRVGHHDAGQAFIHARMHLMEGRTLAQRKLLGAAVVDAIRDTLQPCPGLTIQITAELNEMVAATYQKIVVG